MEERIEKNPVVSLLLLCVGLYFFNLNLLQVSIMEARNFIVAREMLSDGNWLLTTMNGIPRYEKPPFPIWFTLPFIAIPGSNTLFWFRIPTSVFATFGVLLMYFFMIRLTGVKRLGLFAAMILGTTLYYLTIRYEGPSDTYTHVSMFGAIFALFLFLTRPDPTPWLAIAAGLLTGISFLSKGPVSLYAMLLPFLIAFVLVYGIPKFRKKITGLVLYMMISLMTGMSWFLYVRLADPGNFLAIASRETANWSSYNVKPFYFYWNFFVHSGIWAIPTLAGMLMYKWMKKVSPWFQLYKFSLLWMLFSVLLLSLVPEKKVRYLMPVMFPLAIHAAIWMATFIRFAVQDTTKLFTWLKYLALGLPAITAFLFPAAGVLLDIEGSREWTIFLIGSFLFVSTGVSLLRMLARNRLVTAFYLVISLFLLVMMVGFRAVNWVPVNEDYRSPENFLNKENLRLFAFKEIQPEIIWELGLMVPVVDEDFIFKQNKPLLLIVPKNQEEDFLKIRNHKNEIEKIDTFNRNYFRKKNNRYKARYIMDIYRVE